MSLFLGKIHYWLYNKIVSFELIEKEIIEWAIHKGLNIEEFNKKLRHEYGAPLDDRPLEEIIDTSNIHGWLQDKISKAEIRQAALVTKILEFDQQNKGDLLEIYKEQGTLAAQKYKQNNPNTPEIIYNILNDTILEGMPCDQVSEVVKSSNNEFVWNTTMCLHKPYWDKVGGDINTFHELREAWIKNFISALNPEFSYEKNNNSHRIVKY